MTSIYIISSKSEAKNGCYKLGKHTGTKKKLIKRYITSLPDVDVYYFLPTEKAGEIEKRIKKELLSYRKRNRNGHISEWYNLPLSRLIKEIEKDLPRRKESSWCVCQ